MAWAETSKRRASQRRFWLVAQARLHPGAGHEQAGGEVVADLLGPRVRRHLLADRGRHRAPSIPDLILAATAEFAGLTVLHLDKDFEIIADITGQPLDRVAVS